MTTPFSFVLETPPAAPADAHRHFASRLAVETDCADVALDLARGRADYVVADVRSARAYGERHLPGAIHLAWRTLDAAAVERLGGKPVVVYCWGPGCNGATKAAARLASLGVPVKEMLGGLEYWLREGHPTEGTVPADVPLRLE